MINSFKCLLCLSLFLLLATCFNSGIFSRHQEVQAATRSVVIPPNKELSTGVSDEDLRQVMGQKEVSTNTENLDQEEEADRIRSAELKQREEFFLNSLSGVLEVAETEERFQGQIKNIIQEKEKHYREVENHMKSAWSRGNWVRFLIGPHFGDLNRAEKSLSQYQDQTQELIGVTNRIQSSESRTTLMDQLEKIKQVSRDWERDIQEESDVFSLFGWLFHLFLPFY